MIVTKGRPPKSSTVESAPPSAAPVTPPPVKKAATPRKRTPAKAKVAATAPETIILQKPVVQKTAKPEAPKAKPQAEQKVNHSKVAEPQIAEPQIAEPKVVEPKVAEPNAAEPPKAKAEAGATGDKPRKGPNYERLAENMAKVVEHGGKALAAMVKPLEKGNKSKADFADDVADAVKTFGQVAEYWLADPARTIEAQTALSTRFLGLWANTFRRMSGEETPPIIPPDPKDKRFSDPQWVENPVFDFIRQAYSIANGWATHMVEDAEYIDPKVRDKANFYVRQMAGALSPSNFLLTNPELLRATFAADGENLVRGMKMLAEDIEAGGGKVKIRQADHSKFELGVNLATTPGKVVFRNELIELLQYTPTTEQVYKRPLLIVPPWINKFYILDLNPEKSFIRWAVAQGLTVFCISWVNPDKRHAHKDFESYMREGIFAALDQIHTITGERQSSVVGYCVGGTLTAATLAYMAAKNDDRINSATLFTTQVDFHDPGDLKVFVSEERIKNLETEMESAGYLEGRSMANAFNMLRPNDMIWSYVVNNYLKGKEPTAFDLLTWNSDSTRMPRANHSYYLRNCYLNNRFAKGEMVLGDEKLDLGKINIPVYNLAAKEDHIAPAKSVFNGAKLFGGEMKYVMGGSGHIAGVVNPPGPKPKYQYWTGTRPAGNFEDWVAKAEEHPGSWWPNWLEWLDNQAPEKVPAREPGGGKVEILGDAPGEYVRVKS